MKNLSFEYSEWYLLISLLVAIVYALVLYARTPHFRGMAAWRKPLLGMLRVMTVSLIGFLLLGPLFKQTVEDVKKPVIVVLKDRSQSIGTWLDKTKLVRYDDQLRVLQDQLAERFSVESYDIGASVRVRNNADTTGYTDQLTNIYDAVNYVKDIYEGDNLGAVILSTDGIFNDGKNPIYLNNNRSVPIYSIALGDTSQQKDLQLKTVFTNSIAYLYDEMMSIVDIQAHNCSNQRSRLIVEKEEANGQYTSIHEEEIAINSEQFFTSKNIKLVFNEPGIAHFRYRLSTIVGEDNRANNVKDVFVEVLDARQRIAILTSAPHPDIAALKTVLSANKNYEVNSYSRDLSAQEIEKTDMVIFHNLPAPGRNISGPIRQLEAKNIPMVFFVGDNVDISAFNQLQEIISLKSSTGNVSETQATLTANFSLFTLSNPLSQILPTMPPIVSPFGEYTLNATANILLYQKIGGIKTDYPLLLFSDKNGAKKTFFFGTGIWRWKLFDYLEHENFDVFSELLDKTISYTSTKEDKRKFKATSQENIYLENQEVQLTAELYNSSYELINESEVLLTLTNAKGDKFEYAFNRINAYYQLTIGRLPPGRYNFKATTSYGAENFESLGSFTVREIQYELSDLTARHDILYTLAEQSAGKVFYPDQLEQVTSDLFDSPRLKPIIYATTSSQSLIDEKWLFILLALFLSLEWFLRRFWGSI